MLLSQYPKCNQRSLLSRKFRNDICSVIQALGHQYNPNEWCLSIESSKVSLTAVLQHKGNKFPPAPLAHAADMRKSPEIMKYITISNSFCLFVHTYRNVVLESYDINIHHIEYLKSVQPCEGVLI
jgi:hypothetical protein